MNRRQFLAPAGTAVGALPLAAAEGDSPSRLTAGRVDCQRHLFVPEVLDLMRRRTTHPLIYDRDDTTDLNLCIRSNPLASSLGAAF